MNKNYYAIIPSNVRYDKDLKPNAKLLYGEITALCNQEGFCWANNDYFAELYGVAKETVSRWISQLEEKGYIRTEIIYYDETKAFKGRRIYIAPYIPIDKNVNTPCQKDQGGIDEKINTPIDEKVKHNNTVFNNTINNSFMSGSGEPDAKTFDDSKNSNKTKIYSQNSDEFKLAVFMRRCILKLLPTAKVPEETPEKLSGWCRDFDLLIRIDKKQPKEIQSMIQWVYADAFWYKNILSPVKLREKWDRLQLEMSDPLKNTKQNSIKPIQSGNFDQRTYTDEEYENLYDNVRIANSS